MDLAITGENHMSESPRYCICHRSLIMRQNTSTAKVPYLKKANPLALLRRQSSSDNTRDSVQERHEAQGTCQMTGRHQTFESTDHERAYHIPLCVLVTRSLIAWYFLLFLSPPSCTHKGRTVMDDVLMRQMSNTYLAAVICFFSLTVLQALYFRFRSAYLKNEHSSVDKDVQCASTDFLGNMLTQCVEHHQSSPALGICGSRAVKRQTCACDRADNTVNNTTCPVTQTTEAKQENENYCSNYNTSNHCNNVDSESRNISAETENEQDKFVKMILPGLKKTTKQDCHDEISLACLIKSLTSLSGNAEASEVSRPPYKAQTKSKKRQDSESESEGEDLSGFYRGPFKRLNVRNTRNIIVSCVRFNMSSEMARYGTFDVSRSETSRLWLERVTEGGVWVTHLAQAGFYRPQEDGTFLRCAFCPLEVHDHRQLAHKRPMDVHRELSPHCPLVTGSNLTNGALNHFRKARGPKVNEAMFEAPGRQPLQIEASPEPDDSPGTAMTSQPFIQQTAEPRTCAGPRNGAEAPVAADESCLPPSVQSNIPHPNPNEASLAQQSPSLPTNVHLDGHHSLAPFAQQAENLAEQSVLHTSLQETPREQPSLSQTPNLQTLAQTTSTGPARNSGEEAQEPAESSPTENPPPSTEPPRQVVTYAQLGIFTQQPKRQDMVVAATRCNTFTGWPHAHTHDPEEMVEAGFYYTGHGDLVRCFYCKGGLKSWADNLRPWVEHARFFPECPYVNQVKGHLYVEVVKDLHEKQEAVTPQDVQDELKRRKNPALQENAKSETAWMSEGGAVGRATSCPEPGLRETDLTRCVEELTNEIQKAKEERMCKICQVNEVNILFLPCGHLVSCAQCAPALRTCAICRQRVKGRVRVYMDEED